MSCAAPTPICTGCCNYHIGLQFATMGYFGSLILHKFLKTVPVINIHPFLFGCIALEFSSGIDEGLVGCCIHMPLWCQALGTPSSSHHGHRLVGMVVLNEGSLKSPYSMWDLLYSFPYVAIPHRPYHFAVGPIVKL